MAAGYFAGKAAKIVIFRCSGAYHALDGEAGRMLFIFMIKRYLLQVIQQGRAFVPVDGAIAGRYVFAIEGRYRDESYLLSFEGRIVQQLLEVFHDLVEARFAVFYQVHLVHAYGQVRDTQQVGDEKVTVSLLHDAFARIDEDERYLRIGSAGDHVAGIFNMAGRIGDNVFTGRGGEVDMRHIDGDALLTLGYEAVGEQREVCEIKPFAFTGGVQRFHFILRDGMGIIQQAANQCAFAVIYTTGSGYT